ncbi:GMC oxidoreductase [Xylariaceae sp. FL1019]|nr:GMC oxidoreductase [Xylariaceae sp. FL1019]
MSDITQRLHVANMALHSPPDEYGIDLTFPRIPVQNDFPQTSDLILPNVKPSKDSYEYVVIGSGPGGAPLAAKLAQAGHDVLLIDAGGDYGHLREVESPALANPSSERTNVSWVYFTHHYADLEMAKKDRKLTYLTPDNQYYSGTNPPEGSTMLGNWYPRYGGLGGCSEHNALVGLRPSKSDWDNIAELTGDDTWLSDNMLQWFEEMEKLEYPLPGNDTTGHGLNGYIDMAVNPLEIAAQDIKIMSAVSGAAKAFGVSTDALNAAIEETLDATRSNSIDATGLIPLNYTEGLTDALSQTLMWDANTPDADRDTISYFGILPQTMDNVLYRRSSPRDLVYNVATAKNADGTKKYKLDVALNTLGTKVTFDTTGDVPKANGVEYLFGESLYRADERASRTEDLGEAGSVKATKEVIVAGGAYNSPQLLKLSGVGAKEELEQFDIPVVVDLPGVGTNLQDRIETAVGADYPSNFSRILECYYLAAGVGEDPCWTQYVDPSNVGAEKGTYASNGVVFGAFWPSSFSETGEQDLWIGGFPAQFNGFYPGYSANSASVQYKNHWSWLVLKAHTRNRAGTVKLLSANPRDTPNITFHNMYEGMTKEDADKDVGAMVEGMKMAFSFFDNVPDIQGTPTRYWPPPNMTQTDDQIAEWVKEEAWGHHASCSNPIGADDNPMAVLDSKLRVRGTEGLRVVDASVFPVIPGTFPVAPIMMIANKVAADIIAGN